MLPLKHGRAWELIWLGTHLERPSWSSSCSSGRVRGSGSPACRWIWPTADAGSVVLSTLCTYSCPTPPTSASCNDEPEMGHDVAASTAAWPKVCPFPSGSCLYATEKCRGDASDPQSAHRAQQTTSLHSHQKGKMRTTWVLGRGPSDDMMDCDIDSAYRPCHARSALERNAAAARLISESQAAAPAACRCASLPAPRTCAEAPPRPWRAPAIV